MRYTCLFVIVALAACRTAPGKTGNEKRAAIRHMRDDALAELYRREPKLKPKVEGALGYAVFSNFGAKFILVGSGQGYGILVENSAWKGTNETFMRMAEVNVGFGLGVKHYRAIFVFTRASVMRRFKESGWAFEGAAGAGAAVDGTGVDASLGASAEGMWIFILTKTGVELQATVGGTKYWKDDALN